ncbi:MAG: hypothetical protein AB1746_12280 [Candidatus Zixiibacteriota bacterium]
MSIDSIRNVGCHAYVIRAIIALKDIKIPHFDRLELKPNDASHSLSIYTSRSLSI